MEQIVRRDTRCSFHSLAWRLSQQDNVCTRSQQCAARTPKDSFGTRQFLLSLYIGLKNSWCTRTCRYLVGTAPWSTPRIQIFRSSR